VLGAISSRALDGGGGPGRRAAVPRGGGRELAARLSDHLSGEALMGLRHLARRGSAPATRTLAGLPGGIVSCPVRAVAFRSMKRRSSPSDQSRTSSGSEPRPRRVQGAGRDRAEHGIHLSGEALMGLRHLARRGSAPATRTRAAARCGRWRSGR
jgi:hypothetical protein